MPRALLKPMGSSGNPTARARVVGTAWPLAPSHAFRCSGAPAVGTKFPGTPSSERMPLLDRLAKRLTTVR